MLFPASTRTRWLPHFRVANRSAPPSPHLLLAGPAHPLLMLDEPTNNPDMPSTRQWTGALATYRSALLMSSYDQPLLRTLGITRWLRLDRALTEIDPL